LVDSSKDSKLPFQSGRAFQKVQLADESGVETNHFIPSDYVSISQKNNYKNMVSHIVMECVGQSSVITT
jgi:hypothetical protein